MIGKRVAKQERSLAERLADKQMRGLIETAILALVKHGGGRIVVPLVAIRGLSERDSLCVEETSEGIVLRYALDGELWEPGKAPEAG